MTIQKMKNGAKFGIFISMYLMIYPIILNTIDAHKIYLNNTVNGYCPIFSEIMDTLGITFILYCILIHILENICNLILDRFVTY